METRVVAFAVSIISEIRVDRRFDSYKPKRRKIRCQVGKSTAKVRTLPRVTFMERKSTNATPPREASDSMDASPKATTKRTRSKTLKAFITKRRLVSLIRVCVCRKKFGYFSWAASDFQESG